MAGEGVSKNIDLAGPLDAMRQALQGVRDEASRPIEIPVRVVGLDQAKAELQGVGQSAGAIGDGRAHPAPILSGDQDWMLRPASNRHRGGGAWDSPADYPDAAPDRLSGMASEGWDKLTSGGAYHTLSQAGGFGQKWGSFLQGDQANQQRDYSNSAASPEGRKYMESTEEVEKIGKKIAALMREIGQGGLGTVKATEDLKRAQSTLEEVGKAGKIAADGLGGEIGSKARAELEGTLKSAGAGQIKGGGEDEESSHFTPRGILNMVRNPQGAIMQGLEQGLLSKLGGLSPGALGAAGAGGAVAGGAYLAWKLNMDRANDAMSDGAVMGDDVRLSRSLGQKFDFRGEYWKENADGRRYKTKDDTNSIEGRRILQSMGVGFDNIEGYESGTHHAKLDTPGMTKKVLRYAMDNGLESTDLGGALGAAVKSGQVGKDQGSMENYLATMTGHLQRMAAQGITTNESLGAIASLNSRQVQALGRLSEGAGGFNANMLEALAKTGDPSLKGAEGAKALGQLGHISGNQIPMVLGRAMANKPQWDADVRRALGTDAARFLRLDPMSQIAEGQQHPELVTVSQWDAMHSPGLNELPTFALADRIGGGGDLGRLDRMRSMDRNTARDSLHKKEEPGRDPLFKTFSAGGRGISEEGHQAQWSGESKAREDAQRATMATYEAAKMMKDAGSVLNEVGFKFSALYDNIINSPDMRQLMGSLMVGKLVPRGHTPEKTTDARR